MKKIIFIFTLFFIAAGFIYSEKDIKLTEDFLINNKWENTIDFANWTADFKDENLFFITLAGGMTPGSTDLSGKFKIVKNTIILYNILYKGHPYGSDMTYQLDQDIILEFVRTEQNNFYYHHKLIQKYSIQTEHDGEFNYMFFYHINKPVKAGDERNVDGIKVVTVKKDAVTTENLKVRTKPSIKSKSKQIHFFITFKEKWMDKTLPYIPKDYEIEVLGRTEKKEQVHDWNNYWYYVKFKSMEELGYTYTDGWVFGEFVKFSN